MKNYHFISNCYPKCAQLPVISAWFYLLQWRYHPGIMAGHCICILELFQSPIVLFCNQHDAGGIPVVARTTSISQVCTDDHAVRGFYGPMLVDNVHQARQLYHLHYLQSTASLENLLLFRVIKAGGMLKDNRGGRFFSCRS